MAKKKFITCYCSDVGKPKKSSFMNETSIYSTECECRVDGKRLTKHGRDIINLELVKSKRKGYEWG